MDFISIQNAIRSIIFVLLIILYHDMIICDSIIDLGLCLLSRIDWSNQFEMKLSDQWVNQSVNLLINSGSNKVYKISHWSFSVGSSSILIVVLQMRATKSWFAHDN